MGEGAMDQFGVAVLLAILLPIFVLLYGIKGKYYPAPWQSPRGGYHSRRADKSPIHWQVAQYKYAKINLFAGVIGCIIGAVQSFFLYKKLLFPEISICISLVFITAYYLVARNRIEKTLAMRFDMNDALKGK